MAVVVALGLGRLVGLHRSSPGMWREFGCLGMDSKKHNQLGNNQGKNPLPKCSMGREYVPRHFPLKIWSKMSPRKIIVIHGASGLGFAVRLNVFFFSIKKLGNRWFFFLRKVGQKTSYEWGEMGYNPTRWSHTRWTSGEIIPTSRVITPLYLVFWSHLVNCFFFLSERKFRNQNIEPYDFRICPQFPNPNGLFPIWNL